MTLSQSHLRTMLLVAGLLAQGCDTLTEDQGDESLQEVHQRLSDGPPKDWRLGSSDLNASNYNAHERHLSSKTVKDLEPEWVFDEAVAGHPVGPVHATTVIADNRVYVGDLSGIFYALTDDGQLLWEVPALPPHPLLGALFTNGGTTPPPTSAPIFGAAAVASNKPYVVFGDANGRIYARHRSTGQKIWTTPIDDHPLGGVAGNSITIVNDKVIVGLGSIENYALVLESSGVPVQCCSHRGAIVALDLETGAVLWRHDTIPASDFGPLPEALAPFKLGPSGADIWGQPTYDATTNTIYFGTGQNFSPSASGGGTLEADAIVALDADTGARKWSTQFATGDIWVTGIQNPTATGQYLDQDFGDSPKVYTLPNGRRVVGAGQKSGEYRVVDALTGEKVSTTAVVKQVNSLGGLQTGGALTENTIFQHGLDRLGPVGAPYFNGRVAALNLDGSIKWTRDFLLSPLAGGLAVANDLVFFMSPAAETPPFQAPPQWALIALDANSGAQLKRLPFPSRALSSPAISNGHVYLGFGNRALVEIGTDLKGGVMRFGLPE